MGGSTIKKDFIKKDKALIEANYSFSLNEQRLSLILIAVCQATTHPFDHHSISVRSLATILNITPELLYRDLKPILQGLLSKPIIISKPAEVHTTFLTYAVYHDGLGMISFQLSKDLEPYLFQQTTSIVSYSLDTILKLDSKYSIRMYEILKSKSSESSVVQMSLEELRYQLNLHEKKSYQLYIRFKERILIPSIQEINDKTDLSIDYSLIKRGRMVVGLSFKCHNRFTPNPPKKTCYSDQQTSIQIKIGEIEISIKAPSSLK